MRKSCLTSIAAALCAAGVIVETVLGSPVGMTMSGGQTAQPAPSAPIRVAAAPRASASETATPTTTSKASKNPLTYVSKAVSASPILSAFRSEKRSTPAATATPQKTDSISLSTPTGQPTPQLLISSAQMCEQRGDIGQARHLYQQALTMWPGNPEVLRAAARMEDRLGQLPLAESLYQQVVAANPQNAGALNDLGLCLARQGKLPHSLQALEQAVYLDPSKALYRNNAATVCVEMRQDQRAMAHLAAVHGPAEVQYNMGRLLIARNRPADAEAYFKAALVAKPDMQDASIALNQLPGRQPVPPAAAQTPIVPTVTPTQPTAETIAPTTFPATTTEVAPQLGPQFGPQMGYPSGAGTPGFGSSTYVPPTYQPPSAAIGLATSPYSQPTVPWVGQAPPRFLPPVGVGGAVQAGTPVRR
ncbi:MAG: tetratricopeptide repeat protein [Pirellulales bacterium]